VASLCALELRRGALAVQPRAGTLASRERGQAHHLEQLRSLLVEQGSPIVACCRPEVGSFNVRHAPRVSAETNATLTASANPFASLAYLPDRQKSADERVRAVQRKPREAPRSGAWRGASLQRRAAVAHVPRHTGGSVALKINKRAFRRAGMNPARRRTLINSCPLDPPYLQSRRGSLRPTPRVSGENSPNPDLERSIG
jgi:hypothetical protein